MLLFGITKEVDYNLLDTLKEFVNHETRRPSLRIGMEKLRRI